MAARKKKPSSDFQPKHRIVGAAILIGSAVLLFSLLLDGEDPQEMASRDIQPEREVDVPPEYVSSAEETRTFVSKITPIGGATPKAPEEPEPQEKPDIQTRAEPVSLANAGMVAATEPEKPAPPPPASKPEAEGIPAGEQTLERGWMVRVGTFTDISNVERVMNDLRDKGFTPSSTPTKTANGEATRVWLGPYAQRVEAARVRSSLEQSTGEPGLITAYP